MTNTIERREDFALLDRRTWQLWGLCFAIVLSLASGMLVFFLPAIRYHVRQLEVYNTILPQLVVGQLVLVVLCVVYIVRKQRELNELRDFIISLDSAAGMTGKEWPQDPLTGAIERRALPEVLQMEASWVDRYRTPLSLVLTNICAFREVNERAGNLEADCILKDLGQTLRSTCRRSDTILRYGADRFLCFLPRTDTVGAEALCERIRAAAGQAPRLRAITLEFGVALHEAGASPDALLSQAETALSAAHANAKGAGPKGTVGAHRA